MKRNIRENRLNGGSIERQIGNIFTGLVGNLPENLVAERVKPAKNSSFCKGFINIYKKEEFRKVKEEERKHVVAIETFAFYINGSQDAKLESIAIYGGDAFKKYILLKRRGILFGYKVKDLKIEFGRRPFLDVRLWV